MYRYGILITVSLILSIYGYTQTSWPIKISSADGAVIAIYEPQPEKYADNNITARAAVSVRKKAGDEPVFGVMWFDAVLEPGTGNSVSVKSITVSKSKFSDDDVESSTLLKNIVEKEVPLMNVRLDSRRLNEILAQLQIDEDSGIKNDPPKILYREKPTTLILLEGEPIEQQDDNLKMVRVVNSPYLIIKNPDDNRYYLYGGNFWYRSNQVKTGWTNVKSLPSKIRAVDAALKEQEKKDTGKKDEEKSPKFTVPTDILVSTEPAELIQTEGKATYKPIENSTLLYVDNSLDEIFKDIESQRNFILLSGRWYSSNSMEGPWQYVPSDALPAAFANIPAGSEKDGVLANVAGTEAAQEAIVDANIPQMAKVDRNNATCTVSYDGDPKFEAIPNTNLLLAENASITVMLAPNNQYYALENGIWFKSSSAYGPWEVANERPSDVEKIPPGNRAYNTKYVYVYEATPGYVYVGYTPGYLGCYHYRHTIIWGTGWHYRPWYRRHYFSRPFTWGFGMHYNPWYGWTINYCLSFNYGWFYFHHYHGFGGAYGWFGPPMFYPPYRPWGWNGGYYGHRPPNSRPLHRPNVIANRPANLNNRPAVAVRPAVQPNIYQNRKAVVTRDKIQRPVTRPAIPDTRPVGPANPSTRPGVTRPTQPVTRPVNPNPAVRPSPKPTQPSTRPTPSPRPTQPSVKPDKPNPSTRPSPRPVQPPAQPAAKPAVRPRPSTGPAVRPSPSTHKEPTSTPVRKRE